MNKPNTHPVRYTPRALSGVLRELASGDGQKDVTIADIRDALADRSLATFLILSAILNLLPIPPPSTLILGIPLIMIALQMIAGKKTVWLPKFFLRQSLSEKAFAKLSKRFVPWLEKLETVIRPRAWPFSSARVAEKTVGAIALALGIFVFIPLPLTNWIPALAAAICGIALSERDGILLAIGTSIGLGSILLISTLYYFGALAFTGWLVG